MRKIAALVLLAVGPAFAEPPSVETLFKLPQFASMRISPDGQAIAALAPVAGHQNLVILDVKDRKPVPITGRDDRDIVSMQWISSKRLLAYTGRLGVRDFDQRGGAIYAVDRDGSDPRLVSEGGPDEGSTGRFVGRYLRVVRTLPGDSDDIIAKEIVYGME